MPTIICRNCGHTTNTALSDWVNSKDDRTDFCYARLVNNKWEEGCGYGKGDNFIKKYVKDLVESMIVCPFCLEDNFDLVGLKYHLQNYCDKFDTVSTMQKPGT